jgi:hypothetical protein
MKKNLLILTLLFVGGTMFTSCNKKKLDDLEKDLAATKSELNDIKNSNNNNSFLLQSNNPITVTTSGTRGFDDAPYSYTSKFDFAWDDPAEATYVEANSDGTYNFFIERYYQVEGSYDVRSYIRINNFDPAMGIDDAYIEVYFSNYYAQTDTLASLYLEQYGYLNNGTGDNIAVNSFSFNKSTRALNIDLTATANATYPNSSDNAATVRFKYNGVVSGSNVVYREAAKK